MNKDTSKVDPETSFLKAYSTTDITSAVLISSLKEAHQSTSHVTHVTNNSVISDIYNPELITFSIYTSQPFVSTIRDRESRPFLESIIGCSTFLCYLAQLVFMEKSIQPFVDGIQEELNETWNDCTRCKTMQNVLRAAFGLVADDSNLIKEYFNAETLNFIATTVLLQSSLTQSKIFQHILEVFGRIFVILPIQKRINYVNSFIEEEKKNAKNCNDIEKRDSCFQAFLKLIRNISGLLKGSDFSMRFFQDGSNFLHYATDFVSPSLYCIFLQTLACLVKNKELAENVYQRLDKSISDIVNLRRFVNAIIGHSEDLSSRKIDQQLLNDEESYGLEAVIELLTSLCFHSKNCRNNLLSISNGDLIRSYFLLISSPVPASLKGKCFDALSVLTADEDKCTTIINIFRSSQILTRESVEKGNKGIISDIDLIEGEEHAFPLARSFVRFLSLLFKNGSNLDCSLYHQFLFEQCFMKLRERIFSHFNEKWGLLSEISQCWTYMANDKHSNKVNGNQCLLHSAFCDSKFLQEYINFLLEDDNPQECILAIFRLFLILAEKETKFKASELDKSDRSFFVSVADRLSWSYEALVKVIQCIASRDKDLKICSIQLARYLGIKIAKISQVVFSKTQARAIPTFRKIIKYDEPEDTDINVRNLVLDFLISLGSSSYFLRYLSGFNLSDPPKSILSSTLDHGIISILIEKLCQSETVIKYKQFTSYSLKLLLLICDNYLTSHSLINLLSSSNHKFFEKQLSLSQTINTPKESIGALLQLIAREATDGMIDSSSGTTVITFKTLFGINDLRNQRQRVVLIFNYLDQIDNSPDSLDISTGILQSILAYGSNIFIKNLMKENKDSWRLTWYEFLVAILNKIKQLSSPQTTLCLSKTVGFISSFLLSEKLLGTFNIEELKTIFTTTIYSLKHLYELQHNESRLGLYTLLSCCSDLRLESIYTPLEKILLPIMENDLQSSIPVVIASVFTTAEGILPISTEKLFGKFIEKTLLMFPSSWNLFNDNYESGSFVINSQLSFYICLLTYQSSKYADKLVTNALFGNLANEKFWSSIVQRFITSTTSTASDLYIKTATKAIRVMILLSIIYSSKNDVINYLIYEYFLKYHHSFYSILLYNGPITVSTLSFVKDLWTFIKITPNIINNDDFEFKELESSLKRIFIEQNYKIINKIQEPYPNNEIPSARTIKNAEAILSQFNDLF